MKDDLTSLVLKWRVEARQIDDGKCGTEELVRRDVLYECASELENVVSAPIVLCERAGKHEACKFCVHAQPHNPIPEDEAVHLCTVFWFWCDAARRRLKCVPQPK